jgi:hypothetical protein
MSVIMATLLLRGQRIWRACRPVSIDFYGKEAVKNLAPETVEGFRQKRR